MKTLFRIFGILAILIALVMGGLSISRAIDDRKDAVQAESQIAAASEEITNLKELAKTMTGESKTQIDEQIATAEEKLGKIPSPATYAIVTALLAALILLAVVFGVFLFKPNLGLTTKLLMASVILVLAAYFIAPDIARGEYGGFEDKTLALVTGIPAIIAGLFAFLVAKKSHAKQRV